LRYGALDFAF